MVRVGSGGGSVALVNPGEATLGSGSELLITAPTGGSVNKFAIYDFADAQSQFSVSFDVFFSGGSSGTFYFFAGNGANFSDASTFSGSQTFTGLRFSFGTSGSITTNNRAAASWNTTNISGTPFSQGTKYSVAIYGNNSTSSITYERDGVKSVAASTYDLWVNGTRVGTALGKAQLANGTSIDSLMFYGESSTSNVAKLAIDNLIYSSTVGGITAIPEPSTFAALLGLTALAGAATRRRRVAA